MMAARANMTVGILGAGQLGLMLAESLSNLGGHVRMLDPNPQSPGALRTPFVTCASFEDENALRDFFAQCDRVTYEFEHIPTAALRRILEEPTQRKKLWPSVLVLENAQNRIAEKKALARVGAPLTPWTEINSLAELEEQSSVWLGNKRHGLLKTASGGYDGKGQWRLADAADWANALANLPDSARAFPMVLEEKCELETEISVIVGRHPTLGTFIFPAVENIHVNGILDTTLFPARLPYELCEKARAVAEKIADSWDVFGLLCVEFFVVRRNGEHALLVNEVAPRPHNSGHVTRRSMSRSQFDILAQILLDLPFVSQQVSPDRTWAMWNTLGDLWSSHSAAWPAELLAHSAVCEAMLYGKPGVRAGRKMGHVILSAPNHAALTKNIDHLRSTFTNKKGGHG